MNHQLVMIDTIGLDSISNNDNKNDENNNKYKSTNKNNIYNKSNKQHKQQG